jgi:hypothetical protein
MFNLSSRIKEAQAAGAGFVALAAAAIIGIVWLSVWLARVLERVVDPVHAPLLVAALFLIPAGILAARMRKKDGHDSDHSRRLHRGEGRHSGDPEARSDHPNPIQRASNVARRFVDRSPLVAVVIAVVAGVLAVRLPAVLAMLMDVFDEQFHEA